MEPPDCLLRDVPVGVIDEREPAGPSGFTIRGQNDLGGFADA
jgi:hypothetical protein